MNDKAVVWLAMAVVFFLVAAFTFHLPVEQPHAQVPPPVYTPPPVPVYQPPPPAPPLIRVRYSEWLHDRWVLSETRSPENLNMGDIYQIDLRPSEEWLDTTISVDPTYRTTFYSDDRFDIRWSEESVKRDVMAVGVCPSGRAYALYNSQDPTICSSSSFPVIRGPDWVYPDSTYKMIQVRTSAPHPIVIKAYAKFL